MGKRVSIIIPCHNEEPFIARTIESALAQEAVEPEVIVVDDGSSDASVEKIRGFGSKVTLLENKGRGASAARNAGLAAAHGDFVQFLDADDLLDSAKIAKQLRDLEKAGNDAVATCAWTYFTDSIADAAPLSRRPFWKSYPAGVDLLIDIWCKGGFMPCHSFLVPRSLIESAGPWNEELTADDDGEFFGRMLAEAASVVFTEGVAAYYRTPEAQNLSRLVSESALRSKMRATELTVEALLRTTDDCRVREAACQRWAGLAYFFSQHDRGLMSEARSRACAAVADPHRVTVGGPAFRWAARCLGLTRALKLRRWYGRMFGKGISTDRAHLH